MMLPSRATFVASLVLLFLLSTCQSAPAQNGAYFYATFGQLFVYTGRSGHDVEIAVVEGFGWVAVLIDGDIYPVFSSGSTILTASEVVEIIVDTGDGDDTVDLSLVNDTEFSILDYVEIWLDDGDDNVDGPSTDEGVNIFGGDGEDTVTENGSNYDYPNDDVEHML